MQDMRRSGQPAVEAMGDPSVQATLRHYLHGLPVWDRDAYLDALVRRFDICRDWAVFLDQYPCC